MSYTAKTTQLKYEVIKKKEEFRVPHKVQLKLSRQTIERMKSQLPKEQFQKVMRRLGTLASERHIQVARRNALILAEAIAEAKFSRINKNKQKQVLTDLVCRYLDNTIREYRQIGMPTKSLEERLANPEKIVKRIMDLEENKRERMMQKIEAIIAPSLLVGGVSAGIATKDIAGDILAGGGIAASTWLASDYKDRRKELKELKKEYRKERREIEDRLV
jgi:hypothetical protein